MAESSGKSRRKAQKRAPAAGEVGRGVFIQGDVYAQRDVIMGDQYNFQDQRIANIQTPAEFLQALSLLQAQIAALKQHSELTLQQAQMVEIIQRQVQQAVEEARKPEPMGTRITAELASAKATMDLIASAVQSAVGLGATLAGLAGMAIKVFGG